jgi:hypothetical protein
MPTIAITAATPMMIPRAVRTERSLFRRKARNATLTVDPILIAQRSGDGIMEWWSIEKKS